MIYFLRLQSEMNAVEDPKPDEIQARVDSLYGVRMWRLPGSSPSEKRQLIEPGPSGPSWWHGDEEASQGFLISQGVVFGGD